MCDMAECPKTITLEPGTYDLKPALLVGVPRELRESVIRSTRLVEDRGVVGALAAPMHSAGHRSDLQAALAADQVNRGNITRCDKQAALLQSHDGAIWRQRHR
jgi:hypothetical protein